MKKILIAMRLKYALPVIALLAATPLYAAEQPHAAPVWNDPMLILLAALSAVLAFVIFAMGAVMKYILKFKFLPQPGQKDTEQAKLMFLPLLLISDGASAQEATEAVSALSYTSMNPFLFYLFITLISVELFVIALFSYAILSMLSKQKEQEEVKKRSFLEKLNASVPMEREKDVMLDHDYDGIRELDNNLPPWWKYGFYVTIVFAVVYLIHYHVTGSGKLQLAEYNEQLNIAKAEVEEYKKKAANLVDESNVTMLTDPSALTAGQTVFASNCAACHGQKGEGVVGPNLTDAYWLHGGGVQNIFKSIKYGWPQKGMKSWEKDLGARQIQELTSYIISLQGSNPPNAKEQQGDLYEEATPAADSTAATTLKQ